jgi:GNAT superfamily N-acetyltransferase
VPRLRDRFPLAVKIRDGAEIEVRPIRPSDQPAIVAGFDRLSAESRYRRFLGAVDRLSQRDLRYLTQVDHHDHEALAAFAPDGEPIGIARFVRSPAEPEKAEVAVAVVDHWQGRGVGSALTEQLTDRAREEGVNAFTALCLAGNGEVIDMLSRLGPVTKSGSEAGLVELEIELPDREGIGAFLAGALKRAAGGDLIGRLRHGGSQ